jgi:hypothetical protein
LGIGVHGKRRKHTAKKKKSNIFKSESADIHSIEEALPANPITLEKQDSSTIQKEMNVIDSKITKQPEILRNLILKVRCNYCICGLKY